MKSKFSIEICNQPLEVQAFRNEYFRNWPTELRRKITDDLAETLWNRYPVALEKEVTELFSEVVKISPEKVLAGPGLLYMIHLAISVLASSHRKVVAPHASFFAYRQYTVNALINPTHFEQSDAKRSL